ncbi:MAG: GFA family protein [Rhodospirillaceae bacterium]|nr:GFA family protein [Rhodospirillaceae bacterium]
MAGNEPRTPVATGGCQCGTVRYALYAQPEGTHFCHCRMCQKAVGNVFAALAPVRRSDFAWTRGTPAIFRSSTVAERGYCRDCGTPLSFAYVDSAWIDVTLGSLDHPEAMPPAVHYGTEAQMPWLHLSGDWPRSQTQETMAPDRKARIRNFQHPDHDTTDWQPQTAEDPVPEGCG